MPSKVGIAELSVVLEAAAVLAGADTVSFVVLDHVAVDNGVAATLVFTAFAGVLKIAAGDADELFEDDTFSATEFCRVTELCPVIVLAADAAGVDFEIADASWC